MPVLLPIGAREEVPGRFGSAVDPRVPFSAKVRFASHITFAAETLPEPIVPVRVDLCSPPFRV